ncbi:MAG TPA: 50S ribosomal protein L6 [Gemmatales bacterium]|nr:50S ribosomal protein L6 [Gemmatales bacterium]
MSRIGRKPVSIPAGVKVAVAGQKVNVEGPKGKLSVEVRPEISVALDEKAKTITLAQRTGTESTERLVKSLHGLSRTLVNNLIEGVTKGYEKKLKVEGIGYQARLDKKKLVLTVGFANALEVPIPDGITVLVPDPTTINITGIDKQMVGHFAASVRALRKPEPYKGKGIRYENEVVRRKEGKTMGGTGS